VRAVIESHFLKSANAESLGIARIFFYACYLSQVLTYDIAAYGSMPSELWRPTLLLMPFDPPGPAVLQWATVLFELSLLLACAGLFTRCSSLAAALLGTYTFGVVNGFGNVDFHHSPLVLISWVMAAAPCGDAYSVDRLWRRTQLQKFKSDYYWPLRLSQLILVALMFTAGLRKAMGTWLVDPGDSFRSFLLYKYYAQIPEKAISLPAFTLTVAESEWLPAVMGLAALGCEIGCPLAMYERWPWLRGLLIGGLFTMQMVLALWLQTLATFPWLAAYVFWVPWEKLLLKHAALPQLE
jgi:hypothetical protein